MQYMKVFVMMAGLTALLVAFGGYFGGRNGAILVFILAGAVGMLATMARWGAIFAGGRNSDRNPLGLIIMSIVNPLASIRGGGVMALFRTHPPTEDRVSRLREQASQGDY
jgi:Zn-dependent protease with chaperone function